MIFFGAKWNWLDTRWSCALITCASSPSQSTWTTMAKYRITSPPSKRVCFATPISVLTRASTTRISYSSQVSCTATSQQMRQRTWTTFGIWLTPTSSRLFLLMRSAKQSLTCSTLQSIRGWRCSTTTMSQWRGSDSTSSSARKPKTGF